MSIEKIQDYRVNSEQLLIIARNTAWNEFRWRFASKQNSSCWRSIKHCLTCAHVSPKKAQGARSILARKFDLVSSMQFTNRSLKTAYILFYPNINQKKIPSHNRKQYHTLGVLDNCLILQERPRKNRRWKDAFFSHSWKRGWSSWFIAFKHEQIQSFESADYKKST